MAIVITIQLMYFTLRYTFTVQYAYLYYIYSYYVCLSVICAWL